MSSDLCNLYIQRVFEAKKWEEMHKEMREVLNTPKLEAEDETTV